MRLLDTDTLIDIQCGHQPALGWFASLDELPSVPGFVAMELYQGAFDARRIFACRLTPPPNGGMIGRFVGCVGAVGGMD